MCLPKAIWADVSGGLIIAKGLRSVAQAVNSGREQPLRGWRDIETGHPSSWTVSRLKPRAEQYRSATRHPSCLHVCFGIADKNRPTQIDLEVARGS
jgi:hypothetical protein